MNHPPPSRRFLTRSADHAVTRLQEVSEPAPTQSAIFGWLGLAHLGGGDVKAAYATAADHPQPGPEFEALRNALGPAEDSTDE